MPYRVTFEPVVPVRGLKRMTLTEATPLAAWELCHNVIATEERIVSITDPVGRRISLEDLQALAQKDTGEHQAPSAEKDGPPT